jgi:hypothetical protein
LDISSLAPPRLLIGPFRRRPATAITNDPFLPDPHATLLKIASESCPNAPRETFRAWHHMLLPICPKNILFLLENFPRIPGVFERHISLASFVDDMHA